MDDLQAKLSLAKGEYKTALKNLEMISDEIHERRRSTAMGPRGCGVGAEGSNTSVEDLSASKLESDSVSSEYRALLCLGISCGHCKKCRNWLAVVGLVNLQYQLLQEFVFFNSQLSRGRCMS